MEKTIIETIGITLGKRKSRKQKILFINTISQELLDNGVKVQLHEIKKAGSKSTNVLIGSLEQRRIIVAGYDTGSRVLWPFYQYRPFDMHYNFLCETGNMFLYFVLAASFLLLYPLYRYWLIADLLWKAGLIVLAIFVLIGGSIGLVMPSASFNFKRNSIGVAIADQLALNQQVRAGIVLTDYSIGTYIGYRQLADYYGSQAADKTFIIIDAISKGDELFVGCVRAQYDEAQHLAELIGAKCWLIEKDIANTPLCFFPKALLITSGKVRNGRLIVTNCRNRQDFRVDLYQVERIIAGLNDYLK